MLQPLSPILFTYSEEDRWNTTRTTCRPLTLWLQFNSLQVHNVCRGEEDTEGGAEGKSRKGGVGFQRLHGPLLLSQAFVPEGNNAIMETTEKRPAGQPASHPTNQPSSPIWPLGTAQVSPHWSSCAFVLLFHLTVWPTHYKSPPAFSTC